MKKEKFNAQEIKKSVSHHIEIARKGNPDECTEVYSGKTLRTGVFCNLAQYRNFRWHIDEPVAVGGSDKGANPAEMMLAAIAASLSVTLEVYAAYLDIDLSMIEIKTFGNLDMRGFFATDEKVRPGFSEIALEVSLVSESSDSELEKLFNLAEACCPILDAARNGTNIKISRTRAFS